LSPAASWFSALVLSSIEVAFIKAVRACVSFSKRPCSYCM